MAYGVERRKALIDHILIMKGIPVNRRYMPQIEQDSDLKYMLKKGILKRTRTFNVCRKKRRKTSGSHTTYLVLA